MRKFWTFLAISGLAVAGLTGCGSETKTGKTAADTPSKENKAPVTVVANNSWKLEKADLAKLEAAVGAPVKIVNGEESGSLESKLILRKDNPVADVAVGLSSASLPKLAQAGVFDNKQLAAPKGGEKYLVSSAPGAVPIDRSDVCFNYDLAYFKQHKLPVPKTFEDLTKPAYRGLIVIEAPAESDTGFGLLLATVSQYGENKFADYWQKLLANETKVVKSWTDAWEQEYTQGGGKGTRPIVMSYSSSPYWTVNKEGTAATTGNIPDTCYPYVSYAGVLKNAKNPAGAAKVIAWLTSKAGQEADMRSNVAYPINSEATVDPKLTKFAPRPEKDTPLPVEKIEANRKTWLAKVNSLLGK